MTLASVNSFFILVKVLKSPPGPLGLLLRVSNFVDVLYSTRALF